MGMIDPIPWIHFDQDQAYIRYTYDIRTIKLIMLDSNFHFIWVLHIFSMLQNHFTKYRPERPMKETTPSSVSTLFPNHYILTRNFALFHQCPLIKCSSSVLLDRVPVMIKLIIIIVSIEVVKIRLLFKL